MQGSGEITRLLHLAQKGDRAAESRMLELLYGELRRIASAYLRSERREHILQPTALVHEAYLHLGSQLNKDWKDRGHFLAVAARAMRHVLVDCAKARNAQKRGSGAMQVELDPTLPSGNNWSEDILDVHAALNRLAEFDERQAKIVELRFFAGLTQPEVAQALTLSERTVKREWECARAWLEGELSRARQAQWSGAIHTVRNGQ
jgi:RNA polymerase sigma factor (TIGR02999 family)